MISTRRIISNVVSTDFRKSCQIVTENIPKLKPNDVLVKTKYVGVNASDINVIAGRYGKLGVGMEGIGEVVDAGKKAQDMIGRPVGFISSGCYSEYLTMPGRSCITLPDIYPGYLPLLISGLTASISLEEIGKISSGKKVLITAAAGGTGHMAVQIAKLAGCHVIGTCSNEVKTELLESIGCDHIINHKTEDLGGVLKKKYGNKLDVVYDGVGGDVFNSAFDNLGINGRMIILGNISSYKQTDGVDSHHQNSTMVNKLVLKSAGICGFFLVNHRPLYQSHFDKLVERFHSGELKVFTNQYDSDGKKFTGLEGVFDASEFLFSQNSIGKVMVEI